MKEYPIPPSVCGQIYDEYLRRRMQYPHGPHETTCGHRPCVPYEYPIPRSVCGQIWDTPGLGDDGAFPYREVKTIVAACKNATRLSTIALVKYPPACSPTPTRTADCMQ